MAADPSAKLVSLLASLRKQYPGAQAGLFADPHSPSTPHTPLHTAAASGTSSASTSHAGSKSSAATDAASTIASETAGAATATTGTLSVSRAGSASATAARVHGVSAYLDHAEPILCEFVRAFMVWENTTAKAAAVIKRLDQSLVDFNDLRICMTDELLRLMGRGVPRLEERAQRLRAALNGVYSREHAVTLEHLATLSKREAREYLESLDGVPRFVSARVMLVCFSAHAAPVDTRIHRRLVEAQAAEADATPDEIAGQLERRVRAGEMPETYALLQAWADDLASKDDAAKAEPTSAPKPKDGGRTARTPAPPAANARKPEPARDAAPGKAASKGESAKQSNLKSKPAAKAGPAKPGFAKSGTAKSADASKPAHSKRPGTKPSGKPSANSKPPTKRKGG